MNRPESPRLHIIVPTFRERDHVRRLMENLGEQSCQDFRAYIVNCNPGDDVSADIAQAQDSRFVEVPGSPDRFWAGAIRLGQQHVYKAARDKDRILLLNVDNRFGPDFLQDYMAESLARPDALLCALTETRRGYLSSGCRMLSWFFALPKHYYTNRDGEEDFATAVPVDMLAGRALMGPAAVFRDVGYVDSERFPHYSADYEYTLRAKRRGYGLYVTTAVRVFNEIDNSGAKGLRGTHPLAARLRGLYSLRSAQNVIIRTRFVLRCYPKLCVPTGLIGNWLRISYAVLVGTR